MSKADKSLNLRNIACKWAVKSIELSLVTVKY